MREWNEIRAKLKKAEDKLRGDPEIVPLERAVAEAQKTLDRKVKEALDASTETLQIRRESEEVRKRLLDRSLSLRERRELVRRNHELTRRFLALEKRIRSRPDIVALAKKLADAKNRLHAKVTDKLRATSATAQLVVRRDEIRKKLDSLYRSNRFWRGGAGFGSSPLARPKHPSPPRPGSKPR